MPHSWPAWLADNRAGSIDWIDDAELAQALGPVGAARLFVGHKDQLDPAGSPGVAVEYGSIDPCRQSALHVGSAAPVDPVVLDPGFELTVGKAGHHIVVPVEVERRSGI